jgi:hypothetical protein
MVGARAVGGGARQAAGWEGMSGEGFGRRRCRCEDGAMVGCCLGTWMDWLFLLGGLVLF